MNWDFVYRGETRDLDDAARTAAGGSFARLGLGWTHFQVAGPENGRAIVLVPGFSVPYFIWDPTFTMLADSGRRALRYDLYGRGYSDRPRTAYSLSLFVNQLRELIDQLQLDQIDLIGLSMGGLIAAAFSVQHPARVRGLILVGPTGAGAVPMGALYRLAAVPGVSEAILGLFGTEQMVRNVASDFFERQQVESFQDRYRIQMQYRGFKRAILSSIRHGMLDAHPEIYAGLNAQTFPLMIIWGEEDHTVPFGQSRMLLKLARRARFGAIPGCGHIPHFERPDLVNPIILDFLHTIR